MSNVDNFKLLDNAAVSLSMIHVLVLDYENRANYSTLLLLYQYGVLQGLYLGAYVCILKQCLYK